MSESQWTKTQEWRPFAMAALLAFAGAAWTIAFICMTAVWIRAQDTETARPRIGLEIRNSG